MEFDGLFFFLDGHRCITTPTPTTPRRVVSPKEDFLKSLSKLRTKNSIYDGIECGVEVT